MDKYIVAPPLGSTQNSVGAVDGKWQEGYFEKLPNWQEYLAESTGYGIASGCEPTINNLTVTVGAGIVHLVDGTRKEIASTNITLDAADSTNPRIDLVYIDSTGTIAKITGTAAASPSAPALPSGGISICNVSVAAGATTGTVNRVQTIAPNLANYGIVNVKDFGAKGDGVTDDTSAIQAAIQAGDIIFFPAGTYMVDAVTNIKLTDRNNVHIIISPDAEIKAIANGETNYYVFALLRCNNITIDGGGKITGDLDNHSGTTGEWGFGLQIYHSDNIIVQNLEISKMWGDGVYVGDYADGVQCNHIIIRDCYIHHNRRQGITVGYANDVTIDNCLITDIAGVAPQAGIDIETESIASSLVTQMDIRILNTTIRDCAGESILNYGNVGNIRIDNCVLATFVSMSNTVGPVWISSSTFSGRIDTSSSINVHIRDCRSANNFISTNSDVVINGSEFSLITSSTSSKITLNQCRVTDGLSVNDTGKIVVYKSTINYLTVSTDASNAQQFYESTFVTNITSTTGAICEFYDCIVTAGIWGSTFDTLIFDGCEITSNASPQFTVNSKLEIKNSYYMVDTTTWFAAITAPNATGILNNNTFNLSKITDNGSNEGLIGLWAKECYILNNNFFTKANPPSYPVQCGFYDKQCDLLHSHNNISMQTDVCSSGIMSTGGKKYIINDYTRTTPVSN